MNPKDFIGLMIETLNPHHYKKLKTLSIKVAFEYFFTLLFFCIIIFNVFWIINLNSFSGKIDTSLDKFNYLNLTLNANMKEPVQILKYPEIVLYLTHNKTEYDDEFILITNQYLYIKKPDLNKDLFIVNKVPAEDFSDMLANKKLIKTVIGIILIAILPAVFCISYLFYLIKYVLIFFILSGLALIILRIQKNRMKKRDILKIAIFSGTFFIIPELFLKNFVDLGILFLVPYIVFLIVALKSSYEKKSKTKEFKKDIFSEFR
ncbi:DUF1189 domain-containing protein [Candidatus Woesearchaeota archaeon]|nr:DUF1189 domain-containing protein [Candidatus Woesearchaeota archaeon]